jgi:glyoxylase-like metal-dependent hydrolase (beta-lactamase superfamily II)
MRLTIFMAALAWASSAATSAPALPPGYHLIPGAVPLDLSPDSNSIVIDAPDGLIVVDTGRYPEHSQQILDYAKQRGRPIVAIVNTHWHMDHTTGNADLRAVFPKAEVYQSGAVDGALKTFLANGVKGAEARLTDPKTPSNRIPEVKRFLDRMAHPDSIRPTRPVTGSGPMRIAGRPLDVNLASFAATEGDVWLYDPQAKVAVVGDLVVDIVPFMDTACADGWSKALGEIAATPFTTLIPGHGPVMSREDFSAWRAAYDNFVKCGHSDAEVKSCVDGWMQDAAKFIDSEHQTYSREAAEYYLTTRLRSSAEEQAKYCKPLTAS